MAIIDKDDIGDFDLSQNRDKVKKTVEDKLQKFYYNLNDEEYVRVDFDSIILRLFGYVFLLEDKSSQKHT